jgi:meso-butanediol dehydrogenase / (S,S)-butanediol dehydrogenase / diacetyl reductase
MRLKDRVAIITGTGDGQGRAAALRFVHEGARVVGCDLNAEAAAATESLVAEHGGEFLSLAPLDLTREEDVTTLVDRTVERYGESTWCTTTPQRLGSEPRWAPRWRTSSSR